VAFFGDADGQDLVFVRVEAANYGGCGGQGDFVFAGAAAKEDADAQSFFIRGHGNRRFLVFRCQFLVIGQRMGVVAGEVARWFWSDNGDLAVIFLREYLKESTEPFLVSIVYTDAGVGRRVGVFSEVFPKREWWNAVS
jgi:hypothetical protein